MRMGTYILATQQKGRSELRSEIYVETMHPSPSKSLKCWAPPLR